MKKIFLFFVFTFSLFTTETNAENTNNPKLAKNMYGTYLVELTVAEYNVDGLIGYGSLSNDYPKCIGNAVSGGIAPFFSTYNQDSNAVLLFKIGKSKTINKRKFNFIPVVPYAAYHIVNSSNTTTGRISHITVNNSYELSFGVSGLGRYDILHKLDSTDINLKRIEDSIYGTQYLVTIDFRSSGTDTSVYPFSPFFCTAKLTGVARKLE